MTRWEKVRAAVLVLTCFAFTLANSTGLYLQRNGWITEAQSDKWFFVSMYAVLVATLWCARQYFEHKNVYIFIVADLSLNLAALGYVATQLSKNYGHYNEWQLGFAAASFALSTFWFIKAVREKKK